MKTKAPTVAIFGAGIAGLTAAHELAARGFFVYVYDPAPALGQVPESRDPDSTETPRARGYAAGGIARTQYHQQLPGEHGFRFFPSFYRHLVHTMRRIPTKVPTADPRGQPLISAADNLVATTRQGISRGDGKGMHISDRRTSRSLRAVQETLLGSLRSFDYRMIDFARFMLKMVQFMTSCRERRINEYERMSWWDFLGGSRYQPRFREHMNSVTRALVAMDAERSDARTQGLILTQLMLDHLSDGRDTDRLLNGPTSDTWLAPWYRFLATTPEKAEPAAAAVDKPWRDRNVIKFHHGKLVGFDFDGKTITRARIEPAPDVDIEGRDICDYYVLATELATASTVVTKQMAQVDAASNPDDPALHRLHRLSAIPLEERSAWMSGLQFFLTDDIKILPGHVYFPDSTWGLSAVSQAQFWGPDTRVRYGRGAVRGIISVIIANWNVVGEIIKKPAKECTKRELGLEVWHQLQRGLADAGITLPPINASDKAPPPPYHSHHVDHYLVDAKGKPVCDCATNAKGKSLGDNRPIANNTAPVFICRPNTFHLRPGSIENGYKVRLGNLVLAGAYCQTHTGLPTMEAANESARHAVNAILAAEEEKERGAAQREGRAPSAGGLNAERFERCAIFPLEDNELDDLAGLRRVDEMLFEMGDPHMFEILEFEKLLDSVMRRGSRNSRPAEAIHDVLREAIRGVGPRFKVR